MVGIGVILPLLAFAPFGRAHSSRKKNVMFLAGSVFLALLLMATTFTGYLVPARIPFEEWLNAEVVAGRVSPEGAIFRFLVLHCVVLPALVVSLALVMARKLRAPQAIRSNIALEPSATTRE
jgi:hypothetical protein